MVREFLFNNKMEEENNLSEKSKVQLDIKALIGMVIGIVSIAGVWFTLQAEIAQLQLDVIRMQDAVALNEEFRIKWPRGEMGSLPADSEQFMLIEDLYGSVEKIEKHIESMADNRINIDFLRKQVDKLMADIEKLKDANRDLGYKNGQ